MRFINADELICEILKEPLKTRNYGRAIEIIRAQPTACDVGKALVCDSNKVARLTGTAIQDDETFKSEGGFIPERDQYYFQMQQGDNVYLVGFKDLLICLRLLEKMGEIPEIGDKWWQRVATLYGNDILMVEFKEEE